MASRRVARESEVGIVLGVWSNRAVRSGKWKLVALDDQRWELCDFNVDRTEMDNLAKAQPEKVKQLDAAWEKWGAENHLTPLPRDLGVKYLKPD